MNSCGASPREDQDTRLCVGCFNLNEPRTPLNNLSQAGTYILDHSLSGLFIFAQRRLTTVYRPQYLEQKYEVITVHKGNGEIVRKYRRSIKSDTYKRKENNEVISFHRRRKAK